jgi:hypothetical protein
LAKNDSILVDGIIAQRMADGTPSNDRGEAFEYFCFEQLLKDFDPSSDEITDGWVDGRHDGGIDGFYIFVNGRIVSDILSFPWPRSHARLDIFIISCKHHDTFRESTLNSMLATVQEIFDLSLNESELKGAYSRDVLDARERLAGTYKRLAVTSPEIRLKFFYASRGDTLEIGESVRARSRQIEHAAASSFSNIEVSFTFFGAAELIDKYRQTKQFTLELPFLDHLAGNSEGYIILAKLGEYYKFVCDERGALRRYLFDSNVRDYLGESNVNEDITNSLESEFVSDFWWLNNGITILATKAAINGKNIFLHDIQVVNGLQTTESVYRHFKSGSNKSKDSAISIKIIISKDDILRDQIIRATNNQNAIEQAALRATDKIQRDIEQILERHEFYYERRKNYYRNIGRPAARFVTPLFVAAGYVAIALRDPTSAATLRSRFMRRQVSYEAVFSDRVPIDVWPRIVAVLKAAEEEMLAAPRRRTHGERFLRSWRGLVGLLFVARSLGKFAFSEAELTALPVATIDKPLMRECLQFVEERRHGSMRPTDDLVQRICSRFASQHSLTGVESMRRLGSPASYTLKNPPPQDISISPEFIDVVDSALPRQPWPQGTHREIADTLGVKARQVSAAIHRLIESGRRYVQIHGELFDNSGNKINMIPGKK